MNAVLDPSRPLNWLSTAGVEDAVAVHQLAERRRFVAGEAILTEGRQERGLWLVLSGQCEVLKGTNGHTERLAVLQPGEVFGEMSFLQPAPHSATVRAVGEVEAARLSPEAFESLRAQAPATAYRLLTGLSQVLSSRLRRMDERVCELQGHPPEGRRQEWDDFRARLFAGDFK